MFLFFPFSKNKKNSKYHVRYIYIFNLYIEKYRNGNVIMSSEYFNIQTFYYSKNFSPLLSVSINYRGVFNFLFFLFFFCSSLQLYTSTIFIIIILKNNLNILSRFKYILFYIFLRFKRNIK